MDIEESFKNKEKYSNLNDLNLESEIHQINIEDNVINENIIEKDNTLHNIKKSSYKNFQEDTTKDKNYSKSYNFGINFTKNTNNTSKKKIKLSMTMAFFINFKKLLFLIILILGYLINFSLFNLIYFLIAIIFSFNFSDNEKYDITKKKYLIYINIFFSLCFMIFKLIIYCIEPNLDIKDYLGKFFLSLGCFFLRNHDVYDLIYTFSLDLLILIYSFIYLFTCWSYNEKLEIKEIRKTKLRLKKSKLSFLYLILYFIYYCILIINISFTTVFYSALLQFVLIMKIFNLNDKYNTIVFKLFHFLNILHIFITEIANCFLIEYYIRESNIKWILDIIGIIIIPSFITPEMEKPLVKYQNISMDKTTKFLLDFFLTVFAIIIFTIIKNTKEIKFDEKKKSYLKWINNHNDYGNKDNLILVMDPNCAFPSYKKKSMKSNNLNHHDRTICGNNKPISSEKGKLSQSKSSGEQILQIINEEHHIKSNERESISDFYKNFDKNTIYDVNTSINFDNNKKDLKLKGKKREFDKSEEMFDTNKVSPYYRISNSIKSKHPDKKEFNISISSKEKEKENYMKSEKLDAEKKIENINNNYANQIKNFLDDNKIIDNIVVEIKDNNNIESNNTQVKEKFIDEKINLTNQSAFDKSSETNHNQIFENKDLNSNNDENYEDISSEDIDENYNEEYQDDEFTDSNSEYSLDNESEKYEKNKKINKCLFILQTFFHGIYKFYEKIKSFLYAYLFSAYFRLDICRICIIYWIYQYTNYQTIPLILWFFVTILAESLFLIKVITFILAWPSLFINYYFFMISNIDNLISFTENEEKDIFLNIYGLERFRYPLIQFTFIHFTIISFTFLSINLNQGESQIKLINNIIADKSHMTNNNINYNDNKIDKAYIDDNKENFTNKRIREKIMDRYPNRNNIFDSQQKLIEMEDKSDDNINDGILKNYEKVYDLTLSLKDKKYIQKSIDNLDRINYKECLLNTNKDEFNEDFNYRKNTKRFEINPKKVFLEGINDVEKGIYL